MAHDEATLAAAAEAPRTGRAQRSRVMISMPSRSRWHYAMAVCWLVLTVSLASWWLAIGLMSLPTRLHRMFVWEGAAFISLLVAGGVAIVVAIRREHRRRQALETFFLSFTHDLEDVAGERAAAGRGSA